MQQTRVVVAAASLLAVSGCELELVGQHLPAAEDDFFPMRHVAAVSDNSEFVFLGSASTGGLRLVSNEGDLLDEYVLNESWRPVGAATYYGPDFEFEGVEHGDEAVMVLHANGTLLPWFHHDGDLHYHWPGNSQAVSWPTWGPVTWIDVDMGANGTIYVLGQEVNDWGISYQIAGHDFDADGNSVGGWSGSLGNDNDGKAVALAYDQQLDTVNVVFGRSNEQDVTLVEFDSWVGGETRTRTLADVREISDLEVLAGWHYMGVLTCDNAACDESTRELQVRDPTLSIDDAVPVATEGVALDLPAFPLSEDSNVDVWQVGRATWQLSEYDVASP